MNKILSGLGAFLNFLMVIFLSYALYGHYELHQKLFDIDSLKIMAGFFWFFLLFMWCFLNFLEKVEIRFFYIFCCVIPCAIIALDSYILWGERETLFQKNHLHETVFDVLFIGFLIFVIFWGVSRLKNYKNR
jgi:hypothetical protein